MPLKQDRNKTTGRLEALSDGVFAIAITLLANEIGIETYADATDQNLWQKIAMNWPQYFACLTSFTGVLLVWLSHHRVLRQLQSANQRVTLLNGLGLFFVILFPYPSRLVGSFIGTDAQGTAVAFYAACSGFLTLSMTMLTSYISHNPHLLVSPEKSIRWLKKLMKYQLAGFLAYESVAILALYYPISALIILFLIGALWIFATNDGPEENL